MIAFTRLDLKRCSLFNHRLLIWNFYFTCTHTTCHVAQQLYYTWFGNGRPAHWYNILLTICNLISMTYRIRVCWKKKKIINFRNTSGRQYKTVEGLLYANARKIANRDGSHGSRHDINQKQSVSLERSRSLIYIRTALFAPQTGGCFNVKIWYYSLTIGHSLYWSYHRNTSLTESRHRPRGRVMRE